MLITSANSERLFSTLRRLNMYRKNTMGENLLDGLELLNIYRDIEAFVKEVVENMIRKSHRVRLI